MFLLFFGVFFFFFWILVYFWSLERVFGVFGVGLVLVLVWFWVGCLGLVFFGIV